MKPENQLSDNFRQLSPTVIKRLLEFREERAAELRLAHKHLRYTINVMKSKKIRLDAADDILRSMGFPMDLLVAVKPVTETRRYKKHA